MLVLFLRHNFHQTMTAKESFLLEAFLPKQCIAMYVNVREGNHLDACLDDVPLFPLLSLLTSLSLPLSPFLSLPSSLSPST